MRTRSLLAIFAFSCSALAPSACGDDDDDTTTPDAAPDSIDAAAPSPDAGAPLTSALLHSEFDLDSLDPALSYFALTWQYEYVTCAMLLTYADSDAVELVPEIASAMPAISEDGLTYTFRIDTDYQLSPPSGEMVTAQTMKAVFERAIDPALEGPAPYFMADVVSLEVTGEADDELTFTLLAPAADFLNRVAMPFFCAIPADTPAEPQSEPLPTAGPYYVTTYTPVSTDDETGEVTATGELVLRRNPNYAGTRPAVLDEIRYVLGVDANESAEQVAANEVDYLPGWGPAAEVRDTMLAQYGPSSDDPRFFVDPALGYRYLALNSTRPVFADADLRRAVQFAVDRPAIAEVFDLEPDDDYLPPGLPGRSGQHPYPLDGPDVDAAAALIAGAAPAVTFYIVDVPIAHEVADVVTANLEAAGFTVDLVAIDRFEFFDALAQPDEPFDLALVGWFADYPDPFDFLDILLHSESGSNVGHFADPAFDAELEAARALTGTARADEYRRLDEEAMALSPLVVLGNAKTYSFFSERIGCVIYHPLFGINLAALCIE